MKKGPGVMASSVRHSDCAPPFVSFINKKGYYAHHRCWTEEGKKNILVGESLLTTVQTFFFTQEFVLFSTLFSQPPHTLFILFF